MKPIEQVIDAHAPALLRIDGVVGVYEGVAENGASIIRIAVARRTRALVAKLPQEVEGYAVEIVVTGPIGPH